MNLKGDKNALPLSAVGANMETNDEPERGVYPIPMQHKPMCSCGLTLACAIHQKPIEETRDLMSDEALLALKAMTKERDEWKKRSEDLLQKLLQEEQLREQWRMRAEASEAMLQCGKPAEVLMVEKERDALLQKLVETECFSAQWRARTQLEQNKCDEWKARVKELDKKVALLKDFFYEACDEIFEDGICKVCDDWYRARSNGSSTANLADHSCPLEHLGELRWKIEELFK